MTRAGTQLSERDEQRARALHFETFVFDYSPLGEPFELTPRVRGVMEAELDAQAPLAQILRRMWLERLAETAEDPDVRAVLHESWKRSGVNAMQVTLGGLEIDVSGWDAIVRDAARWHRRARVGDDLAICTSAEELRAAFEGARTGVMLGLQDTLAIGTDLGRLETLFGFGVTVVQLTYNYRNLVGDGCAERAGGGLSTFGVELVRELDRLGIVVDLSHCGAGTTSDAIERSERPPAFTHTGCAALNDHPRAKSDEELRRLADAGGYVGIVALPPFLRPGGEAGIDDMIDHIEHAADIVGLDRVGIATDWGIWSSDFPTELYEPAVRHFVSLGLRPEDAGPNRHHTLGEFVEWSDWPQLTRGLVRRGLRDDEIRGVVGGNWLRYLARADTRS